MNAPTNNIEAVARNICLRQLSGFNTNGSELTADVNRYWHCTAAQLESGQIDDTGNPLKNFSHEEGLEAYRDWCRRHPEST